MLQETMEEFFKFMDENFSTFFSIGVAWIVLVIVASLIYRSRKQKQLPDIPDADLRFSELGASGRSYKNFITKLGGARGCLVVKLGRQGLLVRPFFPFNLMFLPEIYDLEHFIPREKIRNVKPVKGFFGKYVLIDFETERGQQKRIELRLRKQDEFLKAMET
jgi:hypothetical protein